MCRPPCHDADVRRRPAGAFAAGTVVLTLTAACSGPARTQTPAQTSGAPPTSASAPATPPAADPYAACARSLVDGMDVSARAGQLLMVGVAAANATSLTGLVRDRRLGGVFLSGRSRLGVARTRTAVDALQKAALAATGVRLEVATDQEGGQVQVLSGPGFAVVPSALQQGTWSTRLLRSRTEAWAAQLTAAGVTLDLAPVADTVAPDDRDENPPIGRYQREYGGDPAAVAQKVAVVVSAMHASGLGSTVKHFPGLGRVHANTDTSVRAVDPVASADDPNLRPFAAGMAAGATAVMVSGARYPGLDPAHVAMFSPAIVTGLLRQKMGWTGLVVSDDMGHAAAVRNLTPQQRAVAFVAAGGDVALTVSGLDAAPMISGLLARAGQDPAFASLVDSAAYRVLLAKVHAGLASCS